MPDANTTQADAIEERRALVARATKLRRRARRALGADGCPAPCSDLAAELAAVTEACLTALATPGQDVPLLGRLIVDLQSLALEVRGHDLDVGPARLARAERGLARLRSCGKSATLLDQVCAEAMHSCGFARVLLSRVENGYWHPWQLNQESAHEPWLAQWQSSPIPLDDSIREGRLLHEHRPELIENVDAPDVHPIVRAGEANSYVVAPIVPAGQLLGFLHADHLPHGRACDGTDRDVLWRFAQGFGHLYERTALLEQMHARRARVRELLTAVDSSMAELTDSELELGLISSPGTTAIPVDRITPPENLTTREVEVLELMVGGANNREIAERLVIGHGTVKTHVKHILAKHGAVNRSQVIARYLRA